jgi:hypothetical protein
MDINIPSQIKLFANLSSFPLTGEVKTLYIDQATANHYYWSGSAYVQLKDGTKFPTPTGTSAQYLRGDGSLATFPTIPSAETESSILAKLGVTKLKVTGDQSTTSTTAVDITDIVSNTLTSGKYSVSGSIGVGSTTSAGLKIGITIPSGATMRIRATDRGSTQNNAVNEIFSASGVLSSSNFAQLNGDSVVFFEGTITIGATSGSVQFIFAKTTSGTATIYDEGTQIKLEKW